jgi:hypothetical protein
VTCVGRDAGFREAAMRKVLAGGLAVIAFAGCATAPSTETFTGTLHRTQTFDGNFWMVEQGPLSGGAYFSGKCMIPWTNNGGVPDPMPKDQGCVDTVRVRGKAYTFTGKSTANLVTGTFRSTVGKETLTVIVAHPYYVEGVSGFPDVGLLVELRH